MLSGGGGVSRERVFAGKFWIRGTHEETVGSLLCLLRCLLRRLLRLLCRLLCLSGGEGWNYSVAVDARLLRLPSSPSAISFRHLSPPAVAARHLRPPSPPARCLRSVSPPTVLRLGVCTEFDSGGWTQSLAHYCHPSIWWTRSIVLNLLFRASAPLTPLDYRSVCLLAGACTSWQRYGRDANDTVHTFCLRRVASLVYQNVTWQWKWRRTRCLEVCYICFLWQLCWFPLQIRSLRCYHWS